MGFNSILGQIEFKNYNYVTIMMVLQSNLNRCNNAKITTTIQLLYS